MILGNTFTISISRKSTRYAHKLAYAFGSGSTTTIASGVATSYDFDTNIIAGHFVSKSSDSLYIICSTYDGSELIGVDMKVTTVFATGTPTINSIAVTPINDNAVINGWNNGNIFVQGYTKMKVVVNYSLPVGTNLSGCKIIIGGATVSDGTATTFTTNTPISESGSITVSATVTDTRNNAKTGSTTVAVYPYSRPYALTADAIRYSTNVNTENRAGTNLSVKATISYSNVSGYNSAGVKVRYKPVGGTYPTSAKALSSGNANHVKINSSALSTDVSYSVQFIVYDSLNTESENPTTIEVIIPANTVTIHSRDGGMGIAFGGYNTLDAIQLWLNTYLYGKLILSSSLYGAAAPSTSGAEEGQLYFQLID